MNVRVILGFIAGAGVGALGSYVILKSYFDKKVEEEAIKAREYYRNAYSPEKNSPEVKEEQKPVQTGDISAKSGNKEEFIYPHMTPELKEMIHKQDLDAYHHQLELNGYGGEGIEPDPPVVEDISEEEFNTNRNYDKQTLEYFLFDRVLTDEEVITVYQDVANILGKDFIKKAEATNADTLYIRNNRAHLDNEVLIERISYEKYMETSDNVPHDTSWVNKHEDE